MDNGKRSESKGFKFKGEWKNDRDEMQKEGEGENVRHKKWEDYFYFYCSYSCIPKVLSSLAYA